MATAWASSGVKSPLANAAIKAANSLTFTWPEFLHAFCALDPKSCKRRAKEPGGRALERILRAPPPPNINSLVRRMKQLQKQ